MLIDVSCVDLTTQTGVAGVDLACTVKVAPRMFAGEEGGPHLPIKIIDEAQAVTVDNGGRSDARGRAQFSAQVGPIFDRLTAGNRGRSGFADVATFLRLRGSLDGLERDSEFHLVTTSRDRDVERLVVIDLAKTIVGHTTERTCRLWFHLHGEILAGHRYECEVTPVRSGIRGTQIHRVEFSSRSPHTALVDATGLTPGQAYGYRLWLRRPDGDSRPDRELAVGGFATPRIGDRRVTTVFGSCFHPLEEGVVGQTERNLQHWKRLAERDDGDVQLFIGDQIYGDEIRTPGSGDTWFAAYVRRYNAFWAYPEVRRALSRRSTYMIPDDHEVKDDWGMKRIPDGRRRGAVEAIRTFQGAHSPRGAGDDEDPFYYSFRRGPAAYFMLDVRSQRGQDRGASILGDTQWRDLDAWALSTANSDADVVIVASPTPVALAPIDVVLDVNAALEAGAGTAGTLIGAGVGSLFGGIGAPIGAFVGGVGALVAYDQLAENAHLETSDYQEMWTLAANQPELTRLLDLLFGLANDVRPRAVFLLGGDCHLGMLNLIVAGRRRSGLDHARNPRILQLTSSAIGRTPADNFLLRWFLTPGDQATQDFDTLTRELQGDVGSFDQGRFVLDNEQGDHYRSAVLGRVFERNLGRLHVDRVGPGRKYRIEAGIEGEDNDLEQVFEIDLDARPVTWRRYRPDLDINDSLTLQVVNNAPTVTQSVIITNFTGGPARYSVLAAPFGPFSWTPVSGTLAHNASRRVPVTFRPTSTRDVRATMAVDSDTPVGVQGVSLLGRASGGFEPEDPDAPPAPPASLRISPHSLNFGQVRPGDRVTRTLIIQNQTQRTITVTVPASISGPFRWPALSERMPNGSNQRIDVRFTSTGAFENATLTVRSDTPASPQPVDLFGRGIGGIPTPGPGPGPLDP